MLRERHQKKKNKNKTKKAILNLPENKKKKCFEI